MAASALPRRFPRPSDSSLSRLLCSTLQGAGQNVHRRSQTLNIVSELSHSGARHASCYRQSNRIQQLSYLIQLLSHTPLLVISHHHVYLDHPLTASRTNRFSRPPDVLNGTRRPYFLLNRNPTMVPQIVPRIRRNGLIHLSRDAILESSSVLTDSLSPRIVLSVNSQ